MLPIFRKTNIYSSKTGYLKQGPASTGPCLSTMVSAQASTVRRKEPPYREDATLALATQPLFASRIEPGGERHHMVGALFQVAGDLKKRTMNPDQPVHTDGAGRSTCWSGQNALNPEVEHGARRGEVVELLLQLLQAFSPVDVVGAPDRGRLVDGLLDGVLLADPDVGQLIQHGVHALVLHVGPVQNVLTDDRS